MAWRNRGGSSFTFIAMARRRRQRGFTLLEIVLATAILGLMSMAVYRFVQANISALRISSLQTADHARFNGLLTLLPDPWEEQPSRGGAPGWAPGTFYRAPHGQ